MGQRAEADQEGSYSTEIGKGQHHLRERNRATCLAVCILDLLLVVLCLASTAVAEDATFEPNWDSLKNLHRVPEWYQDAKFGIFIHWGVYSVPAFGNEWYPRNMYVEGSGEFKHHVEKYGKQSKFGYKDFIPRSRQRKFDAKEWASLFRKAGAKYVIPVAETPRWICDVRLQPLRLQPRSRWVPNATSSGNSRRPCETKAWSSAFHRIGPKHWWFFDGGMKFDSDVREGKWNDLYGPAQPEKTQPDAAFLDNWFARTCELVDKYQPQVVWFDWWIEQPVFQPYLQKFAAITTTRESNGTRACRHQLQEQVLPPEAAVLDIERGQTRDGPRPRFWQTDTSVQREVVGIHRQ